MTLKIDPNSKVTDVLGRYIERTLYDWFRFVGSEPVSYETFSSWEVPLGKEDVLERGPASTLTLANYQDQDEMQTAQRILGGLYPRNACVYSPSGAMYWHTNADSPGQRTYYTFSLGDSVFKYRDPETGLLHEEWDDKGWTARTFIIPEETPFWHCVWTSARRFSFGFSSNP